MSVRNNEESLLREAQMRQESRENSLAGSLESIQVQIQNGTSTQILQEKTTECVKL